MFGFISPSPQKNQNEESTLQMKTEFNLMIFINLFYFYQCLTLYDVYKNFTSN